MSVNQRTTEKIPFKFTFERTTAAAAAAAAVWCNIHLKHMYLVLAALYIYSFFS